MSVFGKDGPLKKTRSGGQTIGQKKSVKGGARKKSAWARNPVVGKVARKLTAGSVRIGRSGRGQDTTRKGGKERKGKEGKGREGRGRKEGREGRKEETKRNEGRKEGKASLGICTLDISI